MLFCTRAPSGSSKSLYVGGYVERLNAWMICLHCILLKDV